MIGSELLADDATTSEEDVIADENEDDDDDGDMSGIGLVDSEEDNSGKLHILAWLNTF